MVVVAFAGCASGVVGQGATGTVTTKLIVAPGVDETAINYSITGNGIDPRTGTIDVLSNPVTAEVAGIPVGSGYTITLATADGICSGSATFDVVENQTTAVTVPIQCSSTPPKRGNILVEGQFLLCPTIGSMVVSPTSVAVGSTIQVGASAKDLGQGTLTYAWTATNDGTFANPGAAKTTYTCATAGSKTLTVTVSNVSCNDTLSVDVTCTQGGGCTDASQCDDSDACTTDACVANACAHTAIAGCCTDASQCNDNDPTTTDTCVNNQCVHTGSCNDITGTWILHLNTTGSITQPIGVIPGANIDYILRLYNRKEGGNLVSTIEICELAATATDLVTSYSDAVIKTFTVSASIPDFCAKVTGPVTIPTFQILSGTKSATFPTGTTSPCSTTSTSACDAAPDTDADGKYGITVTTTLGALNVSAYTGLVFNIGLNDMVLNNATTISGIAGLTTDGFIWGTSLVFGTGPFKLTPDSNAIPIESFLLPGHGEVLCPQVLTHCTTGPTGVCTP
jgi:hypothetical protein